MAETLYDILKGGSSDVALICAGGGPVISRGQLEELVVQFANALKRAGIRPGDVVSIADTNTVEFVVAFLGTTLARAVAAPLNPGYTADEFKFFLEDAGSKLLVLPPRGLKEAQRSADGLRLPTATLAVSWSLGGFSLSVSATSGGLALSAAGLAKNLAEAPLPSDVGLFLHTSGTTSRPKGVPLTHTNLYASLNNIVATYELTPQDRSLLVMPLFHVHGLMAGFLAPLAAGSAVILPAAGRFSAASFWTDAVAHGATFFTAVPTMHQILLARADQDYPRAHPPPLRFIRSCSSSLAAATLGKLEAAFGVPVLEAYAMTEAAHQMTSNPLPKNGSHKAGTVGRAQGGVKVTILDDDNRILPQGKIGEVCIQGSNVTKGYLNNPKANAEAYAGGWFHTGDQGFLDKDGFLTLTGRLKELINRGGEKISPLEIDGALMAHPAVTEAVSFGAPDEKYGEAVMAAVVVKSPVDPEELRKFVGTKLAKFKVPEKIFITDSLPKGPTGKIQRRHMVAHFIGGEGGIKKAATAAVAGKAAQPFRAKL